MATKFPLEIILSAVDRATRPLSRVHAAVARTGRQLREFGKDAFKYVTLPTVAAAAGAVKLGLDFERQFNRVRSVARLPEDALSALQDQVIATGKDAGFGPTSAAAAFAGLTEEWHDTAAAGAQMRPVLALARAGSLEVTDAVKLATNTLYAFRLEATETTRVVDLLARTAKAAGAPVDVLGADLQKVAPVAAAAGFELEETAAALAVLYRSGLEGVEAGTQLAGLLRRLASADLPAAADGSRSLAGVLDALLARGAKGATALADFGEQGRAMAALLEAGGRGVRAMGESIAESAGASEQGAAKMAGFEGALERVKAAGERLGVAIARSGLLDTLAHVVDRVSGWIDRMAETSPATLKFVTALAAVAAVVGPLSIGLGALLTVLAAIASPVGLVVAGVVGLGAAAVALVRNWDSIVAWIQRVGVRITEFAMDLIPDWVKRLLGFGGGSGGGVAAVAAAAAGGGAAPQPAGAPLVVPGGATRADVHVKFENAPRGTRVEVAGEADVQADVGYAMLGTAPG